VCNTQYYIDDSRARHELIKEDTVSDWGVRFDFNLCFSDHVNEKISKAYNVLGVIKRNVLHMDKNTFTLLYKALVRPHLNMPMLCGAHTKKVTLK